MDREIGALWQILAEQAIRVFVLTAFPRAVRMGKVNFDAGVFRQLGMPGHLTALVIGERAAQVGIEALQDRAEPVNRGLRRAVVELDQGDVAGLALDERPDLGAVAGPLDVVAFPMAGHLALFDVGRAQVDAGHVGDLPAPVAAAQAGAALGVAEPQQGNGFRAQLAFRHDVDGLVNGFVAQPDRFVHAP